MSSYGILKLGLLAFAIAVLGNIGQSFVEGHGMLMDPIGRQSRWRKDSSAPANYDDSGLNCGGRGANNGKCGLCGDEYTRPTPRPHELGGKYGKGVIVKEFDSSRWLKIVGQITANHLGHFEIDVCNLDKFGKESEECFAEHGPLMFDSGGKKLDIGSRTGMIDTMVLKPNGLKCKHCVLRWKYVAGNNWGRCADGSGHLGCGIQETFVSCADVKIN